MEFEFLLLLFTHLNRYLILIKYYVIFFTFDYFFIFIAFRIWWTWWKFYRVNFDFGIFINLFLVFQTRSYTHLIDWVLCINRMLSILRINCVMDRVGFENGFVFLFWFWFLYLRVNFDLGLLIPIFISNLSAILFNHIFVEPLKQNLPKIRFERNHYGINLFRNVNYFFGLVQIVWNILGFDFMYVSFRPWLFKLKIVTTI